MECKNNEFNADGGGSMEAKDEMSLTHLTDMNSRSAFQVELQAVSQADHQLPTLWFTATPVLPHTSFHGLTCPTSDSDLVHVCLPPNNFHVESSSLGDLESVDERKLENELNNQEMTKGEAIYSIAPSQLSSAKNTTTSVALSQEEATPFGVVTDSSLIDLGNSNATNENLELHHPSHLQAEIVYQDSNGEISLSTTTVQIPIIRNENETTKNTQTKLEGFVETVECFKCRLCPFISLSKSGVEEHVQNDHSQVYQTNNEDNANVSSDEEDESCVVVKQIDDDKFACNRCDKCFNSVEECGQHLVDEHGIKGDNIRVEKDGRKRRVKKRNIDTDTDYVAPDEKRKQKVTKKTDETGDENGKKRSTRNKNEGEEKQDVSKTSKKRGRPKGSKNTGITALRRKNPKIRVEDELGYRCEVDECAIRMKSIDNLDYHRRCHVKGLAGFTCPECHEKFDHWRNISVHLWRVHVIDMELYACDQCSYKTYSFSKLVNMHKRIHSEDRPFLCDNCGKGFKTSKQLRNHKVIHLDKRRQRSFRSGECDVCHRFFSDKRMLRVHKDTVHNKLRPFLCNYCGYAASCRSTLKMHMRQHTGEKPFSCNFCAYKTADHNSLRRHKMRHSGEKPYKCPFCPYACIQSSTYKTHLKNKHPGQDEGLMYSCNLCAFRTIKRENFITHMADHKAGTIPTNKEQEITTQQQQQETLLVQTPDTLTTMDRIPNQIMFSTIDKIRNKIANASQVFPLEISQMDRYPILVGQLKTCHLDNATVVHIEPNIQLDNNQQQQFLLQEPLETSEQHLNDTQLD